LETHLNVAMMVQIIYEEDLMKISGLIEKSMQLLNGFINYMEKADLK
jgi:hypothetical protein